VRVMMARQTFLSATAAHKSGKVFTFYVLFGRID